LVSPREDIERRKAKKYGRGSKVEEKEKVEEDETMETAEAELLSQASKSSGSSSNQHLHIARPHLKYYQYLSPYRHHIENSIRINIDSAASASSATLCASAAAAAETAAAAPSTTCAFMVQPMMATALQ